MAKCNFSQIAADWIKECVPNWFESCIWICCAIGDDTHTTGIVRGRSGGHGKYTTESNGKKRKVMWRDFIIPVDEYAFDGVLQTPKLGDKIKWQVNDDDDEVCIFEVCDTQDGPMWRYHDPRKCWYRVRTVFCGIGAIPDVPAGPPEPVQEDCECPD